MNKYLQSGRSKQKLKTRNRILDSAQKFLSKGENFTLEAVAEEAGLSRATIYRYYSNVELLAAEAALDVYTHTPEAIYSRLNKKPLPEILLGIQDYYNRLAMDHESSFRKFLSITLSSSQEMPKRGARRIETLKLALGNHHMDMKQEELQNFIYLATVLMGVEALIVTKDVCQLDNKKSKQVLQWGLEMLIKGCSCFENE